MTFPRLVSLMALLFFSLISFAQDSARIIKEAMNRYEFERPTSIYFTAQQMMKVNDPRFYFTFINTKQLSTPDPGFFTPEELPHSLLEMRLAQRFILYRGLESKSFDFMMFTRFTVNFDFVYRIGKKEDPGSTDNPGLPLNTKFGFTLFEHAFLFNQWCDYRKKRHQRYDEQKDFSTEKLGTKLFGANVLRMLVPRVDLMHYSNGQDTGAIVYNTAKTKFRNDYISGNFSTNYLHVQLSYMELTRKNMLLNVTAGIRNDFKMGDWLSFEEKQENRYGKCRINTMVQFRTGPVNLFGIRITDREYFKEKNKRKEIKKKTKEEIEDYEQRKEPVPDELVHRLETMRAGNKMVKGLFDIAFTASTEHIIAGTSDLPNNRTSVDINMEVIPLYWETVGFMLSYYHGRDYLNIRYDLPVNLFKAGCTFQLGRYRSSDARIKWKLKEKV